MLNKKITPLSSGLILGISVLFISTVLFLLYSVSSPLIEQSIQKHRLKQFHRFISSNEYDNNLLKSMIKVGEMKYYFAKKDGKIKILFIESVTKQGYSGAIRMITALDKLDQKPFPRVLGVAILNHQETPGLGDKIESKKSNWIQQFNLKKFSTDKNWQVTKDGGQFDSLTGSTISSRAVVNEVKKALLHWNRFLPQ